MITSTIQEILNRNNKKELRAFFAFNQNDSIDVIALKFNLWARKFFPNYFTSKDAGFHADIDANNISAYRGYIDAFVDIVFRGGSKTSRTKLFLGYAIANDMEHSRRYIKVLCADKNNSVQIVTDIFNMFMHLQIADLYPDIFEKTNKKREETMSAFTTSTGIKVVADTVGTDQRGALQEDSRPDLILFEDFENRVTLRSSVKTRAIWDNMEEARTGLAKGGSCIYNANYLSELANVHRLVIKKNDRKVVLIVPIVSDSGVLTWPERYSDVDIEAMKKNDDDFTGERLCKPSASRDIMFDREKLEKMPILQPIKTSAEFKIYKEFDASHRYGSGHDVAGGVELDSSTSVFIDFDTIPAQVVGTFASNTIRPESFGHEISRESNIFGGCIAGIENNKFDTVISVAKQNRTKLYKKEAKETRIGYAAPIEYGWSTNSLTKPKMIFGLIKAVEDGLIELNDPDLIAECKSYSRNDLMDKEEDPRLATRHFDLVFACAIAWQMKDHVTYSRINRVNKYNKPRPKRGYGRI